MFSVEIIDWRTPQGGALLVDLTWTLTYRPLVPPVGGLGVSDLHMQRRSRRAVRVRHRPTCRWTGRNWPWSVNITFNSPIHYGIKGQYHTLGTWSKMRSSCFVMLRLTSARIWWKQCESEKNNIYKETHQWSDRERRFVIKNFMSRFFTVPKPNLVCFD